MTIIYITLLLLINAFFVAAEFALVKAPNFRFQALAAEGSYLAKLTLGIKANLEAYLAACQLGITMASLGLGWIGEPAVAALLEPAFVAMNMPADTIHVVSFLTGFILFSSLHIVIGEQVPKTYAIRTAEIVSMWCAIPLIFFYYMAFPLNWTLNRASKLTLRAIGVEEVSHVEIFTGSEISGLIDVSKDHGAIEQEQAAMLQNLFRFDERVVHSVMLPRSEVDCLLATDDRDTIIAKLRQTSHSRLPVIGGNWDDLRGVVIVKDVLLDHIDHGEINLEKNLRPPQLVPESQSIRILFETMRTNHEHLAFAVDEFGQIDGLITLEDLLEEVVGDIKDESDADGPFYITETDNGWLVHGLTPMHDLYAQIMLQTDPPSTESTFSGHLMQRLQKIPEVNDTWEEAGFRFTVTKMSGARVDEASVEKVTQSPATP